MKTKVLQVCGQLSVGGQEMMVRNFYKYINRDVFSFDYVVYGSHIGDYEKELILLGAHVYHITYPSLKNMKQFKKEIIELIRKNRYDVIHSHTYTNNGIVLQIAKNLNVPIRISHCHSTESGKKESLIYKTYKKYMLHLIKKNSTHYIACGEKAGFSFYGKDVFSKKGIIIKNGIYLDAFKYNEETAKKIKNQLGLENEIILGHVGRFVDVKNHRYLIDILSCLKETFNNFKCLLIGDGELYEEIKEYAKQQGVQDKILFLSKRSDVNELMQAIDIILCPSKYEGLPVSLVESQASGATCLVSKNVSKEVNISGLVKFLDIDKKSINDWCQNIRSFSKHDRNQSKIIKQKGYDIVDSCKLLEKIYLRKN